MQFTMASVIVKFSKNHAGQQDHERIEAIQSSFDKHLVRSFSFGHRNQKRLRSDLNPSDFMDVLPPAEMHKKDMHLGVLFNGYVSWTFFKY
jgi:hypothetical protein